MVKKLLILVTMLGVLIASQLADKSDQPKIAPTDSSPVAATVTEVIDGDTVKVKYQGKTETLRLIGIDTPEVDARLNPVECYGKEASEATRSLLMSKEVTLTHDTTQAKRDKYDRLLVYLTLKDGTDVGEFLLQEGFAKEYTYAKDYQNQDKYKKAEAEAKNNQKGLWSPDNCEV